MKLHRLVALGAWGAGVYVALTTSCGGGKGQFDEPTGTFGAGGNSGTGGTGAKGVGDPCAATEECRPGLVCEAGACAPGHTLEEGSPCTISPECKEGLYCADGACAPAGDGKDGATCASDADCASGFKCVLVGLGAVCVPEGKGDLGDECGTSADCYGGLACLDGSCGQTPPGVPPFGSPWPGVECADESGPVVAHFRVPRGQDDGDFFRLPFPNDVRKNGSKLDLTSFPTPGTSLLGYDIVDRWARAVEEDNDGWGLYHSTYFRFSNELEFDSLEDDVHLVNLSKDTGMGYGWYYWTGKSAYLCPNWIAVRAAQGSVFEPGDTYAVYLTDGITAKGGAPVTRSPDLDAMLAVSAPAEPALAAQWPKYQIFRDWLATQMIDPSTILNATVFTVGGPRTPIEAIATEIAAAPPPPAASWTLCDQGVASPCPDATGERACPAAEADFHELHALVSLPIYQHGTPPYLDPADGGGFSLDASGNPTVARTEEVCMSLTIPKGAAPAGGWPTIVFSHGIGGHFRSHVTNDVAKDFAAGVDDGSGTVVKAAVLGIDQVQHGPRRGGSMQTPSDLFFNYGNPRAARDNPRQGAVDQMSLLRFVPSVTFDATSSPTGEAFALAAGVAFWGHSQGATQGAVALPFGTFAGAALSGAGGSLIDSLLGRTNPVNVAGVLPWVLSDADKDGKLVGGRHHPVLNLFQTFADGADAVAYGRLATKAPPAGMPAHHVFQPYGIGDTYSPPETEKTYALAAGLGLVAHDPSVSTPDMIGNLTEIPTPASGNLTVAGAPLTALVRQYAPASGDDGHFVAFDVPAARADAERFLAGVLSGIVPAVGE